MCVRSFLHNFESEQSEAHFEKHLMQQHGVKSLQCEVCQFKIRKKESRETLRRMMDQHIFENHYSSLEANEISLLKVSVDRLKNMALKQDLKLGIRTLQCDVCPFKIRKKGRLDTLRRMMDRHIFEQHYSSFEANEISLPKETVHRLQKIAAREELQQARKELQKARKESQQANREKSKIKSKKVVPQSNGYQRSCQPTASKWTVHYGPNDKISGEESFESQQARNREKSKIKSKKVIPHTKSNGYQRSSQPTGSKWTVHYGPNDTISGGKSFVSEIFQAQRNSPDKTNEIQEMGSPKKLPEDESQTLMSVTIPSDTRGSIDKIVDAKFSALESVVPRKEEENRRTAENVLSSNKLFQCPKCSLQFTNQNSLSRHEKFHTGVYKEGIEDWQAIGGEIHEVTISKTIYEAPTEEKITDLPKVKIEEIQQPKLRKLADDEKIVKMRYKCQFCKFTSYDLEKFTKHMAMPHKIYGLGYRVPRLIKPRLATEK